MSSEPSKEELLRVYELHQRNLQKIRERCKTEKYREANRKNAKKFYEYNKEKKQAYYEKNKARIQEYNRKRYQEKKASQPCLIKEDNE
jgi:hypothetical protein